MKIKISALDKMFSDYIRARDNWECQRCGRWHDPGDPISRMGLHCSHFHGRGKKSTRFDPMNACAICFGCHMRFHAYPLEAVEWYKKRIGEKEFDLLTLRANTPQKIDPFLIKLQIKELRRNLK